MKKLPLLLWATLIVNALFAQDPNFILKNNWMVGGRAMFSSSSQDVGVYDFKRTSIGLSPNAGYFVMDKWAIGARVSYDWDKTEINTQEDKQTEVMFMPWTRYYFLDPTKDLNVFLDAGYGFGSFKVNDEDAESVSKYDVEGGLAWFCNPRTALEFTVGYRSYKYEGEENRENIFYVGIGFQIHLDRCGDRTLQVAAKR
jgi:hypothetical protein